MKDTDFHWYGGRVRQWLLDILDPAIDATSQPELLEEDLAQIDYGTVLIDVGWYPAFSPSGSFSVRVIDQRDWERPAFEARCNDMQVLKNQICSAIEVVQKLKKGGNAEGESDLAK